MLGHLQLLRDQRQCLENEDRYRQIEEGYFFLDLIFVIQLEMIRILVA